MNNRSQSNQKQGKLVVEGQAQMHISTSDIPNLGVDVQFDTLKRYLDEISGAVNQHAAKINIFEKDLTGKVATQTLAETLGMVCEGWGLYDNELAKVAKSLMGNGRMENTQSALENAQNKLINRQLQQSHSVTYLFQRMKKMDPKFSDLDEKIKDKVELMAWKEKKKKHKRLFQSQLDEVKMYVDARVKELGKRVTEQVKVASEKAEDIEKRVVWRINEVESTLKHKITSQYVDDSCRGVEERIRREFAQYFIDADRNLLMYNELKQQLKYVDDQMMERLRMQKKQLCDLEENVEKKFLPRAIFDEKTKISNEKIYDIQQRLKELDKRSDLAPLIERQTIRVRQVEEKLQALDAELQRKFAEIMLHQQQEEYKKQQAENLHKICTLEGLMGNMQGDLNKSKASMLEVQTDLVHRMESIEADLRNGPFGLKDRGNGTKPKFNIEELATQRDISQQVETLRMDVTSKLQETIDGVYRDMKKMNEDERTQRMFNQMTEYSRKLEALEQRVAKTSREMDMHSLIKQLREKAETDTVRKDFLVQDTKIIQMQDALTQVRKDVDNMGKIYQKMITSLKDGTLATVEEQLVVMSKRLLPANCISCSTGKLSEKQRKQAQTLKTAHKHEGYVLGTDKRPYKIDVNYLASQQATLQEQMLQSQTQTQQIAVNSSNQGPLQSHYHGPLSSIPSDQDMVSLTGAGYVYLDKSQISSMPNLPKKPVRPSTAKLVRAESQNKRNRPESAKDT